MDIESLVEFSICNLIELFQCYHLHHQTFYIALVLISSDYRRLHEKDRKMKVNQYGSLCKKTFWPLSHALHYFLYPCLFHMQKIVLPHMYYSIL